MKLVCVGGARPNFMKLAPLVRVLARESAFEVVLVHTGQHYDDRMSGAFFRDLGLPDPHYQLDVGSGSHAQQTAEIIRRFEPVVLKEQPAAVIVVGDVNSTVAAALVASKLQIPVVHVEAGLRSLDRSMPEEINRLATDAISDLLLLTEESGRENLRREGIPEERMVMVGNLMIDSLFSNLERARKEAKVFDLIGHPDPPFGVVTLHRPANVDDPQRLEAILRALEQISREVPLFFPVHPRTRARMKGLTGSSGIRLLEPLGYLDFLALMSISSVVLTDSGGIQEETTALGTPCLTVRDNTERPITITQGTNQLAGTTTESIMQAWAAHRMAPKTGRVPLFWDGHAADRCLEALRRFLLPYGQESV